MKRIPSAQTALVFFLALVGYVATAAGTINGDGLTYWDITRSPDWHARFLPGHLLYCPFQAVLADMVHVFWPAVPLSGLMLFVNQLAGAGTVCLVFCTARRFGWGPFAQWLAALGVAFSFGVWVQTTDVEVYALSLLFVTAGIYGMTCYAERPTPALAATLGVLNGLAALFHLATITLGVASVLLFVVIHRRSRADLAKSLAAYFGTALVCFGVPVCAIGFGVLHLPSLGALLAWLKSSEHGYQVVFDRMSIPRALYGFIRTFFFLEFFWTAEKRVLALKALAILTLGGAFLWQWLRRGARLHGTARMVLGCLLGFTFFQVLLGVYFFGSDTERWVFLTPLVWLAVAGQASQWPARQRALAGAAVAVLALVNFAQGIGPLAADHSTEDQVRALDSLMRDDTVVIAPGNDWLGWYYYYLPNSKKPERVALLELAVQHKTDRQALFDDLKRRLEQARAGGREVLLIRVLDPNENDKETPWQELASFGYTPPQFRAWFAQYAWDEVRLDDPGRTVVYRLRKGEQQ